MIMRTSEEQSRGRIYSQARNKMGTSSFLAENELIPSLTKNTGFFRIEMLVLFAMTRDKFVVHRERPLKTFFSHCGLDNLLFPKVLKL
jgi:hypothetical protein